MSKCYVSFFKVLKTSHGDTFRLEVLTKKIFHCKYTSLYVFRIDVLSYSKLFTCVDTLNLVKVVEPFKVIQRRVRQDNGKSNDGRVKTWYLMNTYKISKCIYLGILYIRKHSPNTRVLHTFYVGTKTYIVIKQGKITSHKKVTHLYGFIIFR